MNYFLWPILLLCSGALAQNPKTQHKPVTGNDSLKNTTPASNQSDKNTIDTKNPGTDAVLNSTTGGRNKPQEGQNAAPSKKVPADVARPDKNSRKSNAKAVKKTAAPRQPRKPEN